MNPLKFVLFAFFACLAMGSSAPAMADSDPTDVDPAFPPAMMEVSFQSKGSRLNALLYQANGAGPHPTVLLLHGYPGNEKNLDLAQYFRRDGWNVFFFHYRGAWGSEGSFSFVNSAEDVASALTFLRHTGPEYRVDGNRIAIVGHSMGGQMTLAGASDDEAVSCAVTLAAAPIATPPEWLADEDTVAGYRAYADGLIMLKDHDGSNVLEQDKAFEDAYPLQQVAEGLKGKNLFLIAAENDTSVPISVHESYVELFRAVPEIHLTTQIYPTDHSFSTHRLSLAERITGWLDANCR